ncbi:F-box protein At5g07610-like [Sesamum indicum]|uniref:F-box protein At5g07610-like n=1 Tax=Sesamum indicum TaxID=4182 RepID=A0A6I9SJX0_SESIN|nr:F-box protein At5g07610-like [Sesamum indicum]
MTKRSAEIVAANEDLLTEILLRLPTKSLLRFKCVSIQWLNLISSPYFARNHSLQNPNPSTSGLFLYQYPSLLYLTLAVEPNVTSRPSFGPVPILDFLRITPFASNLTIFSSCNGLLLCLLVSPPSWHDTDVIYFVSNPTTKKSSPLPSLQMLAERPIVTMDLAFDPRESPHYKVICFRHCNPPDGPEFEIQIFSSETGSWKICQGPFLNIRAGILFRGRGVYWNKRIHYLDSTGGGSFYFKVEEESLGFLRMPFIQSEVQAMERSWHLGQSGGHLHLVDIETNITRDSSIDIYELQNDYSGWFLRYRVNLGTIGSEFPEMVRYIGVHEFLDVEGNQRSGIGRYYIYSVLNVVREGDDLFEIVLSIPNKIVCYNPGNRTSKVLVYFGDDRDRVRYEWHNVFLYTQTLLPI